MGDFLFYRCQGNTYKYDIGHFKFSYIPQLVHFGVPCFRFSVLRFIGVILAPVLTSLGSHLLPLAAPLALLVPQRRLLGGPLLPPRQFTKI